MNERLQAFALAAILAACLAGAGRLDMDMARARDARRPGIGALKGASPGFMLAVTALGGFRGVLVDLLWSRAVDLQDRGAYFEIAQLADWITKLEPDLTGVWTFHAWNMAYNIGYTFPDPRDRWRWVKNGISLLRDEGLAVNPADGGLCLELGWIYQHKIGGRFDTAHPYFKAQLAAEMDSALGGPGPSRLEGRREAEFRARFKLDPSEMRRIDRKYGPLDWRLPESHALYWALQALARTAKSATILSAHRMLYQSMAEAFRNGRLEFNPDTGEYATRPNIELLPKALRAFEEALGAFDDKSFRARQLPWRSGDAPVHFQPARGRPRAIRPAARSLPVARRARRGGGIYLPGHRPQPAAGTWQHDCRDCGRLSVPGLRPVCRGRGGARRRFPRDWKAALAPAHEGLERRACPNIRAAADEKPAAHRFRAGAQGGARRGAARAPRGICRACRRRSRP